MGSSFDDRAATWDDDPVKVERAREVAAAIRETVPLHRGMRVLEYGAGTGLVSQELSAEVGRLTLADSSVGMRAVMTDKITAATLPPDTRIWDVDLTTGQVPAERFDVILTVLTLHHIPDLAPVLAAFGAMLVDGGWLAVADLVAEDGSFHDSDDFEGHHGFDTEDLSGQLREAGFDEIELRHAYDLEKNARSYPVFVATARRTRPM